MENKINGKTWSSENDRNGQKRGTDQVDKLLGEQYTAETKVLESALLRAAGKNSWDDFTPESEEEIQEGYDRLIARLKEKGEYREEQSENRNLHTFQTEITVTGEHLTRYRYEWNRTHRLLKPVAAVVATVMLTALAGMSAAADHQALTDAVQISDTVSLEKK